MLISKKQSQNSLVSKRFCLRSRLYSPNVFFSFIIARSTFLCWQYSFSLGTALSLLKRYRHSWKELSVRGFTISKKVWVNLLPIFSFFLKTFYNHKRLSRFFIFLIRPTLLLVELLTSLLKGSSFFKQSVFKIIPTDCFGKFKLKKKRSLKKKLKKKMFNTFNF